MDRKCTPCEAEGSGVRSGMIGKRGAPRAPWHLRLLLYEGKDAILCQKKKSKGVL